jgi:8-oxo-dGTP pyrophosphatase MutT (NUDIX family)
MMKATKKVYAYITCADQLLVFEHTHFPEAGIQVPGGTVEQGESLEKAVLREAVEETGLQELAIHSYLGMNEYNFSEVGSVGIYHLHFFHLHYSGEILQRWRNFEMNPSDGSPGPIEFELYWVKFPKDVPELIASQGEFLSEVEIDLD